MAKNRVQGRTLLRALAAALSSLALTLPASAFASSSKPWTNPAYQCGVDNTYQYNTYGPTAGPIVPQGYHQLALDKKGKLYAWGGHRVQSLMELPPGDGYTHIFSGYSSYLVYHRDGGVWFIKADGGQPAVKISEQHFVHVASSNAGFVGVTQDGYLRAWPPIPSHATIQTPTEQADYIQLTKTNSGFAALRADGSLLSWGSAIYNTPPTGNDFVKIYSNNSSFAAQRKDGSIAAWGHASTGGQSPAGTGYGPVMANQSAFAALDPQGKITAWGGRYSGGFGEPTESGYQAIRATINAMAALHKNGYIRSWGSASYGGSGAPAGSNFTKLYSNYYSFAALRQDGSVASWGYDGAGAPSAKGYTKIASSNRNFAALHKDGHIAIWGFGIPYGPERLSGSNFVNIISTTHTFIAVKADGNLVTWEQRDSHPQPNRNDLININGRGVAAADDCDYYLESGSLPPGGAEPLSVKISHSPSAALYCPSQVRIGIYRGEERVTDYEGSIALSHSANGKARWSGSGISASHLANGKATLRFSLADQGEKTLNFTWLENTTGQTTLGARLDDEPFAAEQALNISTLALQARYLDNSPWVYAQRDKVIELTALSGTLDQSGSPQCKPLTELHGNQRLRLKASWPDRQGVAPVAPLRVAGQTLPSTGQGQTLTHNWYRGKSQLRVNYADMGQVQLQLSLPEFAQAQPTQLPNPLTAVPKGFSLGQKTTALKPDVGGFLPAGTPFELILSARGDLNDPLPSFGKLGYLRQLSQLLVLNANGNQVPDRDQGLLQATQLQRQSGEVIIGSRYDDLGQVTVRVAPRAIGALMGAPLPIQPSQTLNLGNFYPAYYQVIAGSMMRGELATHFASGSYLGATVKSATPASISFKAYNAQGQPLDNLQRISGVDSQSISVDHSPLPWVETSNGIRPDTSASHVQSQVDSTTNPNQLTVRFDTQLSLERTLDGQNQPPAPFTPNVSALMRQFTDAYGTPVRHSNGATVSDSQPLSLSVQAGEFRYGQAELVHGQGGALETQTPSVVISYFDGQGFVANTEDNSTTLSLGAPVDRDPSDGFDFSQSQWQNGLNDQASASGGTVQFTLPSLDQADAWGTVLLPLQSQGNNAETLAMLGLSESRPLIATYGIKAQSQRSLDSKVIFIHQGF